MLVHRNGHVTGDYVRETSATGVGFLVPTGVLATQRATRFDVATPPPTDSNTIDVIGPKITSPAAAQRAAKTWFLGPSITGVTPQRAHVELVVTGDPGRRIYLSFEESCGFVRSGGNDSGAHGQRVMRAPAVMIVPMLTTKPENRCYVSGLVAARRPNELHISLIDY